MRRSMMALLAGIAFLSAEPAQGQVAWDGPLLISPSAPDGWGLYLADPSPGGGIGVLTTWRGNGPLGFRIGLGEDRADEIAVYGGVDVSAALIRRSEDFPLDLDWVLGAGLGIGDAVLIAFPIGVSLGRDVEAEGVWFNPYVAPRVVVDAWLGSAVENEMNLGLAVDLGLDISFDPGWAIRFGASLGEREALAIGFSFRLR